MIIDQRTKQLLEVCCSVIVRDSLVNLDIVYNIFLFLRKVFFFLPKKQFCLWYEQIYATDQAASIEDAFKNSVMRILSIYL